MGGEAMRKCTSLAPASRIICTIFTEVVPRTMESSMSTIRLPLTTARLALCLRRTPSWRICWLGSMKVPDIVVADDAELIGNVRLLGIADRRRDAGIGNRDYHVGGGGRLASELRAHGL